MSTILNLHLDILDKERQNLLEKLQPFVKDFVLGGGTALALQLGHRLSFDFDFFFFSPIPKNFLEKLSQHVQIDHIAVDSADELTFFTQNGIKVTFLSYPFPPLYPPREVNFLKLFQTQDLAYQKAYTIGRRGEYRDYFDLYTILKEKVMTLEDIISGAKKVFGAVFDEKIFLQQLVYFDDLLSAEVTPLPKKGIPTAHEIQTYLEKAVSDYLA